jgi:hypothetical protein
MLYLCLTGEKFKKWHKAHFHSKDRHHHSKSRAGSQELKGKHKNSKRKKQNIIMICGQQRQRD